jgi:hypothetical protein
MHAWIRCDGTVHPDIYVTADTRVTPHSNYLHRSLPGLTCRLSPILLFVQVTVGLDLSTMPLMLDATPAAKQSWYQVGRQRQSQWEVARV